MQSKRYLMLEDGSFYEGYCLGFDNLVVGEIVFNTAIADHQKTISDPPYTGQIITFTYPLTGNYGINRNGFEPLVSTLNGIVVKEADAHPGNFRQQKILHDVLELHQIPGIAGADTRNIVCKVRQRDVLKAGFTDRKGDIDQLAKHLQQVELPKNEVETASTKTPHVSTGKDLSIVLVDFGKEQNIVRKLNVRGCSVTAVPYITTAEKILTMAPDGVMLSNGPGNPEVVECAVPMIQGILGKIPFFGTCLGHQLFALSQGASSLETKFSYRGANHPVKNLEIGKADITDQNHGYAIDIDSLKSTDLEVTHLALNDSIIEGLKHKALPALSVQYCPEANPRLSDSNYLFGDFVAMMINFKEKRRHIDV